jgi:heme-degrading monooxygenase HmoA
MLVVIFRAKIKKLDAAYSQTAARMRELALAEFGCLEFYAITEGDHEVALSYWPDEASIKAWRMHPEHLAAQKLGKEHWYESYSVQVAEIGREYHSS